MAYNIFITHAWKEDEDYRQIESWIKNSDIADKVNITSNLDKDALPEGKNLRDALTEQIAAADCVILIGNMYKDYAGWMDHQFLQAKTLRKRIVLIKPFIKAFAANAIIPFPVQGGADTVISFHELTLIGTIRQGVIE